MREQDGEATTVAAKAQTHLELSSVDIEKNTPQRTVQLMIVAMMAFPSKPVMITTSKKRASDNLVHPTVNFDEFNTRV